jgi:hypothetical protein
VRELTLDRPAPAARLLIAGDEEYLVYLDGTWVGAEGYAGGDGWDAYPVGRLLRPGRHLLTVELRSSRGVGGLLLCLELEPGAGCAVRSDGSWRIHQAYRAPGEPRSDSGRAPRVWGGAQVGGWPAPRQARPRPLFADCLDYGHAYPIDRNVDRGTVPMARDDGTLVEVPERRLRWRHPMEGVFILELAEPVERQVALLTPLPRSGDREPHDPRLVLVTQPGQRRYASVGAYRLWSVEVTGEVPVATAFMHPLRPGCEALRRRHQEPPSGLLGFAPLLGSPVEHELRGEL